MAAQRGLCPAHTGDIGEASLGGVQAHALGDARKDLGFGHISTGHRCTGLWIEAVGEGGVFVDTPEHRIAIGHG